MAHVDSSAQPPSRSNRKKGRDVWHVRNVAISSETQQFQAEMEQRKLEQQMQEQFNDILSRFQSKEFFQSEWDIASFAVFFIFIGIVLLLFILVLIRCCCCCCCCCDDDKPRGHKVGIENIALER